MRLILCMVLGRAHFLVLLLLAWACREPKESQGAHGSVRFGSVSVGSGSVRFRFGPVPVQLGSGSLFPRKTWLTFFSHDIARGYFLVTFLYMWLFSWLFRG